MNIRFGQLFKQNRELSGKSQDEFRELLNRSGYNYKSNGTISKWENGYFSPKANVVAAIEDIFDLDRGVLLSAAGYQVGSQEAILKKLQHYKDLGNLAAELLKPNLEIVRENPNRKRLSDGRYDRPEYLLDMGKTREQLSNAIDYNFEILLEGQPNMSQDIGNLITHLTKTYKEIAHYTFDGLRKTDPYRLIKLLGEASRKRDFKGTCPVCEGL